MAEKFIYIFNDDTKMTPSVENNLQLICLVTQLNEPTNQNSIKVLKVDKPTLWELV